eukprot:TRINITY_DN7535_c0_g1_i1.p1 TRINITY_DN7535_c0_g1~~TRINITY_DN7535_c0_g1_i1.p1  ORF type:complete len:392 (+),score=68.45 TRINITY_DN7535_c0_g1_i1:467-1642(+)
MPSKQETPSTPTKSSSSKEILTPKKKAIKIDSTANPLAGAFNEFGSFLPPHDKEEKIVEEVKKGNLPQKRAGDVMDTIQQLEPSITASDASHQGVINMYLGTVPRSFNVGAETLEQILESVQKSIEIQDQYSNLEVDVKGNNDDIRISDIHSKRNRECDLEIIPDDPEFKYKDNISIAAVVEDLKWDPLNSHFDKSSGIVHLLFSNVNNLKIAITRDINWGLITPTNLNVGIDVERRFFVYLYPIPANTTKRMIRVALWEKSVSPRIIRIKEKKECAIVSFDNELLFVNTLWLGELRIVKDDIITYISEAKDLKAPRLWLEHFAATATPAMVNMPFHSILYFIFGDAQKYNHSAMQRYTLFYQNIYENFVWCLMWFINFSKLFKIGSSNSF